MMKGSLMDLGYIIFVVALALSFTVIFSYYIGGQIRDNMPSSLNSSIMNESLAAMDLMNYGFIAVIVAAIMSAAIMAYFVYSHPIFIVAAIIMLAVIVLLSAQVTNLFAEVAGTAQLASTANHFNVITEVMLRLPQIALLGGVIIILAMFAKWRSGYQGGGAI